MRVRVRSSKIEVRCGSACGSIIEVRVCVRHTVKFLATQHLIITKPNLTLSSLWLDQLVIHFRIWHSQQFDKNWIFYPRLNKINNCQMPNVKKKTARVFKHHTYLISSVWLDQICPLKINYFTIDLANTVIWQKLNLIPQIKQNKQLSNIICQKK